MSALSWSKTPAQNAAIDPSVPAAPGTSARQYPEGLRGVMAGVAALSDAQGGALVSSGTDNVYVVATNAGVTLRAGVAIRFWADRDNTAPPFLDIDGTGPRPWRDATGLDQPGSAVLGGVLYEVAWNGAIPGAVPEWRTVGAGGGASGASVAFDYSGAPSSRATYDGAPKGKTFLSVADTPIGPSWLLYIKRSNAYGDWSGGLPIKASPAQSTADAQTAAAQAAAAQAAAQIASAAASAAARIYPTRAALQADLSPPDRAGAQVTQDGSNNGTYAKAGASGTGSWVLVSTATIPGLAAGKLDTGGDGSGLGILAPSGAPRLLAVKAFERKTIDDFYRTTDLGDMAPAIERAAYGGVRRLNCVGEEQYILKRPFEIPNGSMCMVADARKQSEFRLTGTNDYFGVVGTAANQSYNFYVENLLFTKERASQAGAVFKLQNLYKWGFSGVRVYGENKIWRVLELLSASSGMSRDVDVDSILERAVYAKGGPAGAGTPGGWVIDNTFDLWYVIGAVTAPADPFNDGAFYFEDCFQAQWISNHKVARSKGYAVCMLGTLANRGINTLNLIENPNVEASASPAGVAKMLNVTSSQVSHSGAWSSASGAAATVNAKGMPAYHLGPNSQNCYVSGIQTGLGGGIDGVLDEGTQNTVRDMEFVGYDSASAGSARGVVLAGQRSIVRGVKGSQIKNAVAVQDGVDPTNAGHHVTEITGVSLSGRVVAGLDGAGTNRASAIYNQDSAGYLAATGPTLIVPDGQDELFLSVPSAVTLWRLEGGPRGRVITLMPNDPNLSVADRFASSPPAGVTPNIQLASRAPWTAPVRDDAIRGTLTLKQVGGLWKEVART